jgi:hypothetical protein
MCCSRNWLPGASVPSRMAVRKTFAMAPGVVRCSSRPNDASTARRTRSSVPGGPNRTSRSSFLALAAASHPRSGRGAPPAFLSTRVHYWARIVDRAVGCRYRDQSDDTLASARRRSALRRQRSCRTPVSPASEIPRVIGPRSVGDSHVNVGCLQRQSSGRATRCEAP